MTDPWAFGWTQVFTLVGFAITLFIAVGGFRTFERWRQVSAQMLYENPFPQNNDEDNRKIWAEWRATVWGHGFQKGRWGRRRKNARPIQVRDRGRMSSSCR